MRVVHQPEAGESIAGRRDDHRLVGIAVIGARATTKIGDMQRRTMERFNKVFPLPFGRIHGWCQRMA
jgi:hypothetical protein